MIKITVDADSTEDALSQIRAVLGGEITERWGEYTLLFDNDIAKGCIRCINFDWGISLMEFDVLFFDDILIIDYHKSANPLHFSYCSRGSYQHRFENQCDYRSIGQYHSSILVAGKSVKHFTLLQKDLHIIFNNIRIIRTEFLKKRNSQLADLNEILHRVFVDENNESSYAYYSPIHLRMEDHVKSLRDLKLEGMTRVLQIEGEVYQLIAMHIARHDKHQNNELIPNSLLKDELNIIGRLGRKILSDPSLNYNLDQLSSETGLSQAKLQEGFKFLYARTVTEYIRHTRLEAARDLMNTTDLNISQIVYTIGFTSRSYFSKIFKDKYSMTPHEFKKQVVVINENLNDLEN
ncbi:helix-turn-helix transcriptional regulator [Gelidibacter salicanalis]|uniref:Helix-turn-helix transcriptional regulator n=1 Tax=Gelidibacter salicanalis TaxID=291193 RepID=A0A934KV70_9FLAO|nr:AraC family transcriptional regulator [Gelidibacter salicanalis]MBJ7880838.1 helix-turn-helix transcriptional regulator [Gelidibacter salicanalis]